MNSDLVYVNKSGTIIYDFDYFNAGFALKHDLKVESFDKAQHRLSIMIARQNVAVDPQNKYYQHILSALLVDKKNRAQALL